ncbi:hypothetical protein ACIP98_20855 [Streptomyces sp. NPDC088354]|uniref:hypothetical protein n=1 Tax=Streptomyces sp. NPDC088354 TaxID=3365856 RepID=UPI0038203736
MSELFGLKLGSVGPAGILALVVVFVIVGRLVPRRTVDDIRADRDAQLADARKERDTWRDVALASERARMEQQAQNAELLELSRTAVRVLTALPAPPTSREEVTADAAVDTSPAAT